MKLEMKNVKFAEFASEETNCYSADIFVNGKKAIHVSNNGHGGCDYQTPIKPFSHTVVEEVNEWCKNNLPKWGGKEYEFDADLESWCGDKLNLHLISKKLKRLLKKKVLFVNPKDNAIYEMGWKKTKILTPKHFEYFKNNNSDVKEILNLMPFENALALYKNG